MEDKELQEFDLDDILSEFSDLTPETEAEAPAAEEAENAPVTVEAEAEAPAAEVAEAPQESDGAAEEIPAEEAPAEAVSEEENPLLACNTVQFEPIRTETPAENAVDPAISEGATTRIDNLGEGLPEELELDLELEPEPEKELPPPIEFNPKARLRELKRKLVAGPEKRYYELSEQGVIKLQMGILVCVIIVILCALTTSLFAMGMVPENRLRFVIFSQVLAMLVSALMGCNLMLDSLSDLFRGRFTVNTLLSITFVACCVDAALCLRDLRVPCCGAFSLEMAMALWGVYHRRTTEMAQMDTLRKAVKLKSLVKVDDYHEGQSGILRDQGELEAFTDNYNKMPTPERVQSIFAFVFMLLCFAISAFAGILHGTALAIQILATSLLVAVPASSFITVTRPMAILERRLHMVGTVFCGWKGVRKLTGKAMFPLADEDLFPLGASKLNGMKFYGSRNPDEVVSYTASLIAAAGGGLVTVFRQTAKSRNCPEYPVDNFHNYGGGGIGGEVQEEPVLVGTLEFLQDMGVKIPEGTMVNQAVYVAIDGQLSAVFAISYAKMRSASAGLVSLCGTRKLTTVLTGGDFMITEELIRNKFGVNTRRMSFPDPEVRAQLNRRMVSSEDEALALTTRDDLVSSVYAISGARCLRTSTNLGVAIHLVGGIVGLVIMLVLGYLGSTQLLTPTNVLLYQLVWLVPGLLITEWTRTA